jgi:hypothetical protein
MTLSFVITVYVPEGIVMAADSRQIITIENKMPNGTISLIETIRSNFVYKIFYLAQQQVGISTFGESILGKLTIESHIKRFAEEVLEPEDDVASVPERLVTYFQAKFPNSDTAFHVSGYKRKGKVSQAQVTHCQISRNEIKPLNIHPETQEIVYGTSWGGQGDIIANLLQPGQFMTSDGVTHIPKPPILFDTLPLQDAIDFSIYAVRTTIDTMRFQTRPKNVGGPIDVLVLSPEGSHWVQRKGLHGERRQSY